MASKNPFLDWVECPECYEEQPDGDYCEKCGAELHPIENEEYKPQDKTRELHGLYGWV